MSDLDVNELLKLLDKKKEGGSNPSPSKKTSTVDRHIENFCQSFNISKGTNKVANYVIWYIYYKMWDYKNSNKYSKIEFFRKFSKVFDSGRIGSKRYYNLSLELSKELIREAKEFKIEQDYKKQKRKV